MNLKTTLNCYGQLVDLTIPSVMGILNCTPNSFYDGGKFQLEKEILLQVEKMLLDGATYIDIGGNSSKPNSDFVTQEEELSRVLPVIQSIYKHFPKAILSIDTFRSKVAQIAVENGVAIVNDISAGNLDNSMMETVGKLRVPYIMMHMKGNPKTMQSLANYENIVKEMIVYFSEKVALAGSFGINDLILDPGFGFSKLLDHNFELLSNMELLQLFELPILVGLSRKSMIYKLLDSSPSEALNGTTSLHTIALMKGAKILRVHDVKEAVECVKLYQKMNNFL